MCVLRASLAIFLYKAYCSITMAKTNIRNMKFANKLTKIHRKVLQLNMPLTAVFQIYDEKYNNYSNE